MNEGGEEQHEDEGDEKGDGDQDDEEDSQCYSTFRTSTISPIPSPYHSPTLTFRKNHQDDHFDDTESIYGHHKSHETKEDLLSSRKTTTTTSSSGPMPTFRQVPHQHHHQPKSHSHQQQRHTKNHGGKKMPIPLTPLTAHPNEFAICTTDVITSQQRFISEIHIRIKRLKTTTLEHVHREIDEMDRRITEYKKFQQDEDITYMNEEYLRLDDEDDDEEEDDKKRNGKH